MADAITHEFVLSVPVRHFERRHAWAMDHGGSLIKVTFTEQSQEEDQIQIRCATFRKDNIREALTFLRDRVAPDLLGAEPLMTCGIGIQAHEEMVKDILGVSITNVMELDVVVEAFLYLSKTLPTNRFLHPRGQKVKQIREEHLEDMKRLRTNYELASKNGSIFKVPKKEQGTKVVLATDRGDMPQSSTDKRTTEPEMVPVHFPTILMMCGSASCPILVQADGKFTWLDSLPVAGCFLMGLGKLLTGVTDFDELMSRAAQGDEHKLNLYGRDLATDGDDPYAHMPRHLMAYSLGNTLDKDSSSFHPNDVAATVVTMVTQYTVHCTQVWAINLNVKEVFFFGSLTNSEVMRDEIAKQFTIRSTVNALDKWTDHYFIQGGCYLGALGCLLRTLKSKEST